MQTEDTGKNKENEDNLRGTWGIQITANTPTYT